MQSTDQKIKALHEAIKKQDHNEVYEYSKALLKQHPDDLDYQQSFILSSFKISLTSELGQTIFKTIPQQESLSHLYAYYLYDLSEYDKAINYINGLKNGSSLRLLLAQCYFRIHNYDKSAQLMLNIIKDSKLSQQDRQTYLVNLFATGINKHLSLDVVKQYQKILIKVSQKQLLYNYALLMFDANEYNKCLNYLKQFEGYLQKENDSSDIMNVRLMRDLIDWRVNKTVDRNIVQSYENLHSNIEDLNVIGVVNNNLLFLKNVGTEHTHQTLKMMEESLQSQYKMTRKQRSLINLNKLSILLKKARYPEAIKLLKQIQATEPQKQLLKDIEYIKNKYFLLKKSKDGNQLANFMALIKEINPQLAFVLRADLAKQRGQQTQLISELKNKQITNQVLKNYIFSLLVKNSSLFDQYSDYLTQMSQLTKDMNVLNILLNVYESKKDLEKQKYILQKMYQIQPKNISNKVKLSKIYLQQNKLQQAQTILKGIEGPQEISDITYLQYIQKNIHVSIKKDTTLDQNGDDIKKDHQKKKIKKKKKPRLPKNIDKIIPNFKGDPERWLPKWQRKGYKKKGKKGGKTQGLATVGKEQTKNVFTTGASTSSKQVTREGQKKRK